ncbi:MAG: hypothetical protein ACQEUT_11950 [Bacillota bacterium]
MIDFFMVLAFSIVIIYAVYKNKDILKKLSTNQILGVTASYLAATIISFSGIYYFGNWIVGYAPNSFLSFLLSIVIILSTLFVCISILNKVLEKITNGILPKK